ncbi:MAG: hypothetical protein JSV32_00950, partial [Dehalococcoidia bacterium]
ATGTVLSVAQISWNIGSKKANLQRDASYAMLAMSGPIKAASSVTVEPGGRAIKIYNESSWIRFSSPGETKDLRSQIEGKPEILICDKVENLVFSVEGNKVGIDLNLEDGDFQTHLVSTVMMRNYGG